MRGQDELLDLHRNMDQIPVDGVRQLESPLPLVLPERVNKLRKQNSCHMISGLKLTAVVLAGRVLDLLAKLAKEPLINERGPPCEQVNPLETCLLRVLAGILEKECVQFATHVVYCP